MTARIAGRAQPGPTPPPSPDPAALLRAGLAEQITRTAGPCHRPLRLAKTSLTLGRDTGHVRTTAMRVVHARCGNRRESRCPSCSILYKYDTYNLIAAGLRGGKQTPNTVASHPRLFITLTAPSFGPVHLGPAKNGQLRPCRPRRAGQGLDCRTWHRENDPLIGTPLDPDTYDYAGHVLFNALAGKLWSRFTIDLRRHLAHTGGLPRDPLGHELTLSYAKVAEYQARGIDAKRTPDKQRCCAIGACCKLLPAPRRLQYYHGVLTSALAHAVREDMIPRNVAKQVQSPTGPPRRYEPFTLDEAHAFLKETRRFHNGELYELALRTGMRRGELLGLRWSDIDFDNQRLTIRRTLQRIKGQGLVEMPTKTDTSDRRIPLSPLCIKVLKDHLRYQQAERDRAAEHWKDSGYVFTTSLGTPLDPQHVTHNIKALCDRAGVRQIRFHDLRHTCATLLIETGVPLITVKVLLGHANIAVTANIYTHTRLPHQADALKQLDTQLDQPEPKPRRARAADSAPDDENDMAADRTEETPPTSTGHIS